MIRKRNGKDITDEEFLNIIVPFENILEKYFIKNERVDALINSLVDTKPELMQLIFGVEYENK